jgi:hypothetical protein
VARDDRSRRIARRVTVHLRYSHGTRSPRFSPIRQFAYIYNGRMKPLPARGLAAPELARTAQPRRLVGVSAAFRQFPPGFRRVSAGFAPGGLSVLRQRREFDGFSCGFQPVFGLVLSQSSVTGGDPTPVLRRVLGRSSRAFVTVRDPTPPRSHGSPSSVIGGDSLYVGHETKAFSSRRGGVFIR